MIIRFLACVFFVCVVFGSPVVIKIDHRFGISSTWETRGSFDINFNRERRTQKAENLKDDAVGQFKNYESKLEVILNHI